MKKLTTIAIICGLTTSVFSQNFGIDIASPTQKLDVNGSARIRGDIFADNNYGQGLVGLYSDTRYQNVFAMGAAYRLAADGTTPGNLYGLAWTHQNIGGQSKSGLGHQLLAMSNGVTTAAMGNGFWTNYTSYMPFIYDVDNTGYYLDPNGTSELNLFTRGTLARSSLNSLQNNSPVTTRSVQGDGYRNGSMGWGTYDFNTIYSNWGSGFIDTWSNPGNAPGGSSHYVGLQGMHLNHQDGTNAYGFQMACAGEANNRFFWRSGWPSPRPWVEMIHSGNISSFATGGADNLGNHSATTTLNLNNNAIVGIGRLEPYVPGGNSGQGGHAYAIFQEAGGWGHPYPDLRIAYHTGIKFGANYNYDGIRFYTDYDMSDLIFQINDQSYSGFHNTTTWGYAYAYGFYGISSRELKKEIQKFDDADYKSALALVDDVELNYFRYKKSDLVPGIHIGLIAEEAPIIITDGQKKGISAEKLSYVLTGAVRVLKKKVETLEAQIRDISDFGADEISSNQLWVKFSEEFKAQLEGIRPVVTVTPAQSGTDMWVSEISQEGFKVEMTTQSHAIVFNWIALAKLKTNEEDDSRFSERFEAMQQSVKTEKRAAAPNPDSNLVKPMKAPADK